MPAIALLLCAAAAFLSSASSLPCSVNVVAQHDAQHLHPSFNHLAPTLGSLAAAVEFVAGAISSSRGFLQRDITICIFGTHYLSQPLVVDQRCTPASDARVIWLGFDATVSGAIPLQSWQLVSGSTYSVKVPSAFTGPTMRDVWPAGRRAARSTLLSPEDVLGKMTPWQSSDGAVGFSTERDIPAAWQQNIFSIEFVWPIVVANWIEPRCCVSSIVGRNITLSDPCGALLLKRNVYAQTLPPPVRIEAVLTDVNFSSPGSFFHDKSSGTLYYTLQADQTLADLEARSFTSAVETLLVIFNTSQHSWINVSFQYSTWFQPNMPAGFVDTQSCVFASDVEGNAAEPPAAVAISFSSDVEMSGCFFSSIGSPYALFVGNSSNRVNITSSYFYDLSGGAVRLGNVLGQHDSITDGALILNNNRMSNGGRVYSACAAIFAGYVFDTKIIANTITDFSYSSISVGWGWGGSKFLGYGNNVISFNRMQRIMTALRDGGGIYVNGWTNPSYRNTISFNWCDADDAVFAIYYLDNGSSRWDVRDNVGTNSPLPWCYFMTGGGGPSGKASNSSISQLWCKGTSPGRNDCPDLGCTVDNSTVFYLKSADPLPDSAQRIVDSSGSSLPPL